MDLCNDCYVSIVQLAWRNFRRDLPDSSLEVTEITRDGETYKVSFTATATAYAFPSYAGEDVCSRCGKELSEDENTKAVRCAE